MIHGVVFDLDGTLVDSKLNFPQIRVDLGLEPQTPILESVRNEPDPVRQKEMWEILISHEDRGAQSSEWMPGAKEWLDELREQKTPTGLFTRNSRRSVELTFAAIGLTVSPFSVIVTRDDGPPKPDPHGLKEIARQWNVPADQLFYVGDYLHDLQAAKAAGAPSVLLVHPTKPLPEYRDQAHHVVRELREARSVFAAAR